MNFLLVVVLLVLIGGPIAGIVAWVKVRRLEREVHRMRLALGLPEFADPPPAPAQPVSTEVSEAEKPRESDKPAPSSAALPVPSPAHTVVRRGVDFERLFGTRLAVWLGGLALAVGGLFLVKYSIDQGLLTPLNRVILGGIAGLALLLAGGLVRERPRIANGRRIAQALTGAGIAVLYVSLFAASDLYGLLPPAFAFIGMVVTTVCAVGLSIRQGMPVAVLGIVGGYATPLLVGAAEPNSTVLFTYLFFLFAGLLAVVRQRGWWPLAMVSLAGALMWVPLFLRSGADAEPVILIGYLVAVAAVALAGSWYVYRDTLNALSRMEDLQRSVPFWFTWGAILGVVALAGVVVGHAGYGLDAWLMFAVVAAAAVGLMVLDARLYGPAALAAGAVTMTVLLSWLPDARAGDLWYAAVFGLGFVASGYAALARVNRPLYPAILTGSASLAFYLFAFFQARDLGVEAPFPLFWGLLAFAIAGGAIVALRFVMEKPGAPDGGPTRTRDYMVAIFAVVAAANIAFGLTVEIEQQFLGIAFAAQLLAVAWINARLRLKVLDGIALALSAVFAVLLVPQMLLLVRLSVVGLVGTDLNIQESVPIVDSPIFQLGLPAALFLFTARELRRARDGRFVFCLEAAAIGLAGLMGYYLTRHAFNIDANVLLVEAGFLERGVTTSVLFAFGLACLWLGRRFARPAFSWSGVALAGVAIFRVVYFDILFANPVWSPDPVGGWAVLNPLLLPFGLTAGFAWLLSRELVHLDRARWSVWLRAFTVFLLFVLVTMNVRHIFHAPLLDGPFAGNAEIYAYSVVWLLFGLALLGVGFRTRDRMVRFASLAVMLLAVGKVFLFDAAETEGLFRVLSFVALGLSLIGLSLFYTRYVLRQDDRKNLPPA